MHMQYVITHRGETRRVDASVWESTLQDMIARLGPWEPDKTTVQKATSDWGTGQQIVDEQARERIEVQHAKLREAGLDVGRAHQFYDTGTRMAADGYATQAA